jgi:hypothetical protein
MIIESLCNSCFQIYELRVEPEDMSLLKMVSNEETLCQCPRQCGGSINIVPSNAIKAMSKDARLRPPLPITVKELFKAVHGGGLPDEIPKSFEFSVALFKAHPVKDVSMEQDGEDIYLHEIRFADGSVLHLSAGRRGAKVLKITKEEACLSSESAR